MMTGSQQKFTFTSYVDSVKIPEAEPNSHIYDPRLLSGEITSIAADVYMFPFTTPKNDESIGIPGKLFVTNFKLSFVPSNSIYEDKYFQNNRLIGTNDVSLSNIDVIYQIVEKKKKRIFPHQQITAKIDALYIICKNFRFLKFGFKIKDQGTLIASALARFAFPPKHDLSFAFYYKNKSSNSLKSNVTMFNTKNDWISELRRCGASEWKVVSTESFETSEIKNLAINSAAVDKPDILPRFCVIPKCFNEKEFLLSTSAFCDSRGAFWVYSYGPTGASLVRMGELKSYREGRTIENITLEKVRNCDPRRKSIEFKNLSEQFLPTIYDIRRSYLKLRELCTPESHRDFLIQDSKFCSLLDKSGWLKFVSICLKFSLQMSEFLRLGTTVVLQESNAREMSCVISSIIQVILDPYFRTFNGFQSLIQKEWIALEHPFSDRLGHIWKHENIINANQNTGSNPIVSSFTGSTATDEESPLLLLFLDCIWQLLQQFPEEFEFSQTFLTTIWDSAFMPIFDTFQFNSEYDRHVAVMEKNLVLRPVWDWNEQFDEKEKIIFFNPLYLEKPKMTKNYMSKNVSDTYVFKNNANNLCCDLKNPNQSTIPSDRYLEPIYGIPDLKIWEQCFYRWLPILEIGCGGFPQIDLLHRLIVNNISKLQRMLKINEYYVLPNNKNTKLLEGNTSIVHESEKDVKNNVLQNTKLQNKLPSNVIYKSLPVINSFFPFSVYKGSQAELCNLLMHSNESIAEN